MELVPVAFASLLVAIAGPLGISLGWWLGRRGERERKGRGERKSASVAFARAAITFRNATVEVRHEIRGDRSAALAEIVLVAPPDVVEAASYHISTGDRLLEPGLSAEARQAVLVALGQRNR